MADEMVTYDKWLRDLDEEIEFIADVVGVPGERSIARRLDTIERVLFAVARAQGVDPDAV
ncbi:hypothetical protein ACFVT5_38060 [Streptomyces sp. NPDC058001]|uniref:hypothetical protein n=1 Tax=Streptomyces sp. NPDC058001 TaxID=3346300 RepID=UPI0036F173F5